MDVFSEPIGSEAPWIPVTAGIHGVPQKDTPNNDSKRRRFEAKSLNALNLERRLKNLKTTHSKATAFHIFLLNQLQC